MCDASDETSRLFISPLNDGEISDAAIATRDEGLSLAVKALAEYARFEDSLAEVLKLTPDDLRYLDAEVGLIPKAESSLGHSDIERPEVKWSWDNEPDPGGRWIVNGRLEAVSLKLGLSAHDVVMLLQGTASSKASRGKLAADRLSYLLGIAFGRWDIRVGRDPSLAAPPPHPLDPIPVCAPGMLLETDRPPKLHVPPLYPVQLLPERFLLDEPGHPADVGTAVRKVAAAVWDEQADERLADIVKTLGHRSLQDVLRQVFWKDHLARYSKSRRQAPLYWPLTTASKGWGVWIYAPSFTRETLFAVAAEAGRRERLGRDLVERLAAETASPGRSARQLAKELEAERRLVGELDTFRREADRLAALGWEPDLEDGFVLCAAPLFRLLPQWKDAADRRRDLKAGKYPWASVASWKDQL